MVDHTVITDGSIGLKLAYIIAGFFGGVVSLSFIKELNRWQAFIAVFTGAVSAGYGTPVTLYYLGLTSPALENGTAFFIGLTAMNIIPGVVKLSEVFRRHPASFFGRGGDEK
jgi:hypothetical protein